MPRNLKLSRPLIIEMLSFDDIGNFFKWENIYIKTFRIAHWNTLDDSLMF